MTGMIDTLTLRFGPTPDSAPLSIRPGAMTVLVGPNNSGKSALLREIQQGVGAEEHHRRRIGASPSRRKAKSPRPARQSKILRSLRPALPATGAVREHLCEAVRQGLEELALTDESRASLSVENLFGHNAMGAWLRSELQSKENSDEAAGLADVLLSLQANSWRDKFLEIANRAGLDAHAFCEFMSIAQDVPLRRLLCDDEASTGEALQQVLKGKGSRPLTKLVKRGLDMIQRFQPYIKDSEKCAELIARDVVDLTLYRHALAPFTVLLDGNSRLREIHPRPLTTFYKPPEHNFGVLLNDREALERLRAIVHRTFGFYLAIDILDMKNARFVTSKEPPEEREFSLGPDAIKYFKDATDLRAMSDGVRSFVGIHAVLAGRNYRLILIDEPEAFLHPPLVRRLGFDLTRMAAEQDASIIAATHSADFLMGCVEAGHDVDVIRLGYENNVATARALPASDLMTMMRKPLLRSTGVLSALFHRAAVVCEGDSDGAFYGEINERLRVQAEGARDEAPIDAGDTGSKRPWIRDAVFINAHSKASVPELMGALRRVGVPAAAIVDLDLLIDDEVVPDLLKSAGAVKATYAGLGQSRRDLLQVYQALAEKDVPRLGDDASADDKRERKEKVKRKRSKLIKRGGIANLPDAGNQRALRDFLAALARHGIFVPECGDLESWLPRVSGGMGKGKRWLPTMFEKMGTLGQDDYMKPGDDDVWTFIQNVARWIEKSLVRHDWLPMDEGEP